jgi:hypothetical protein
MLSVSVTPPLPHQPLNDWTNLCGHLNDVLHKSLPSVCVSVCVSLFSLLSKRLGKHVPAPTNTSNNIMIFKRLCLWVCLCIPLLLLDNNSVTTYPRQRRIAGDVIFYAVRVVSKESMQLVFLWTSHFCHDSNTGNNCMWDLYSYTF